MAPTMRKISDLVLGGLVQLITLPYHRFFIFNTLKPAQEIELHAADGIQRNSTNRILLHSLLTGWRARKKDELAFVSIAGVAVTAIVTASVSWPAVATSYWVASGFWSASLMTSVCGILIAAQHLSLLTLVGELLSDGQTPASREIKRHLNLLLTKKHREIGDAACESWQLSWNSVFRWQGPMMFIGYSFLFYFMGLTVLVCTPLINREEWGPDIYVPITYLAASGLSWGIFVYCSLGGYRAVPLHEEDSEDAAAENVPAVGCQEGKQYA